MRRMLRGIVLASLAVTACANEADGESVAAQLMDADANGADEPGDPRSNTPRVTVGEASPAMGDALLVEEDVVEIRGLRHVTVTPVDEVEMYENPDPRGPCGAEVEAFSVEVVGARMFTTRGSVVVENLVTDVDAMAREMDVMERDLIPGCGSHESATNVGTMQQVSEPTPLDLAGVGDRAIGWTTSITSGGVTVGSANVFVVDGDRGFLLDVLGNVANDHGAVLDLAERATERLHA